LIYKLAGDLFANLVRSLPHLESLSISQDITFKVNDTFLKSLCHTTERESLPELRRLTLAGDIFTDQFLHSLLPLVPHLRTLTLIDCNITDLALEIIVQQLPKIASLRIEGAHPSFITEQGLTHLLSNCQLLDSVQISAALNTNHFIATSSRQDRWRHPSDGDKLTGADVLTNGTSCLHEIISEYSEDYLPLEAGSKIRIATDLLATPKPNLRHLQLNHVTITDRALVALLRHVPHLRSLSLVSAVIVDTASPLDVPCTGLQCLALIDVVLEDHVLRALLHSVPDIQSLCLYYLSCPFTTPHCLAATSSQPWVNLRRVILGRWQSLNDTVLATLLSRVTRLECLELIDLLVPLSLIILVQTLALHNDSLRTLVLNHCSELDQQVVRSRLGPHLTITFM